jgi:hypothetical protein
MLADFVNTVALNAAGAGFYLALPRLPGNTMLCFDGKVPFHSKSSGL